MASYKTITETIEINGTQYPQGEKRVKVWPSKIVLEPRLSADGEQIVGFAIRYGVQGDSDMVADMEKAIGYGLDPTQAINLIGQLFDRLYQDRVNPPKNETVIPENPV